MPAPEDINLLKKLSALYEERYNTELASMPVENKKALEEVYQQRWDNIKKVFDEKEIYTSPEAQKYLDALVAGIIETNPLLHDEHVNCYFSRSGVPNASYIGEGIILFNMGLFSRLSNESQVVFVLCHELSHFFLKHSENSMRRYVTAINSADVQRELHKIKSTVYGKRQQVEDLQKSLVFDFRRHGRDHESEADSMALEFMRHTSFDISEALAALSLLDSIDTDTINIETCLRKFFDSKDYPFQNKWLTREEGLLGGHAHLQENKELADSLKTHPDCKARIKLLEPMVDKYKSSSGTKKNMVNEASFLHLKSTFSYEAIEFDYASGNYTKSLYYSIELLKDSTDPYLIAQVGKILNSFFAAQKLHTLGKIIELPSPYHPDNYNQLLQFVQNLYLEDFSSISYNFLKQYHPLLDYYSPFTNAYKTSKQIISQ